MRRDDSRSRLVAIVADFLINPDAPFYQSIEGRPGPVFDVLVEDGWGLMKAAPHVLKESVGRSATVTTAGDAADYLRYDHAVVILAVEGLEQGGVWLNEFETAFGELKTPMPKVVTIGLDPASRNADYVRAKLAEVTVEIAAKT
jgi:hypothetical protein